MLFRGSMMTSLLDRSEKIIPLHRALKDDYPAMKTFCPMIIATNVSKRIWPPAGAANISVTCNKGVHLPW